MFRYATCYALLCSIIVLSELSAQTPAKKPAASLVKPPAAVPRSVAPAAKPKPVAVTATPLPKSRASVASPQKLSLPVQPKPTVAPRAFKPGPTVGPLQPSLTIKAPSTVGNSKGISQARGAFAGPPLKATPLKVPQLPWVDVPPFASSSAKPAYPSLTGSGKVPTFAGFGYDDNAPKTAASGVYPRKSATAYVGGKAKEVTLTSIGNGNYLRSDAADAFAKMKAAALRDGITLGVNSAFRDNAKQKALYDLYKSGKGAKAARPGFSNHQGGVALDLQVGGFNSQTYRWLQKNAWRFGFTNTEGKRVGEAWHWVYAGTPI